MSVSYSTLQDWVNAEAHSFSLSPQSLESAIAPLLAAHHPARIVGLGEPTHGVAAYLELRNRLFRHLVEHHGFTSIAIESSFPRSLTANDWILGRSALSWDELGETGFSHGFGRMDANRRLIEWMRDYNADPSHPLKLHFYGFDSPTEMTGAESPRPCLEQALHRLAFLDSEIAARHRDILTPLFGDDNAWNNFGAMMDPSQSIGRSPQAVQLRAATEDLLAELDLLRPLHLGTPAENSHLVVRQLLRVARQLLNYHAEAAGHAPQRISRLLGLRDASMADNLACIASLEQSRGRTFAFAHNSHLQRGTAEWQLGPTLCRWSPAGAHLGALFGPRYLNLGVAAALSPESRLSPPEPGTLEHLLSSTPGPLRLIPTRHGRRLPPEILENLPTRSCSHPGYFPLSRQSLDVFDALIVLDDTSTL